MREETAREQNHEARYLYGRDGFPFNACSYGEGLRISTMRRTADLHEREVDRMVPMRTRHLKYPQIAHASYILEYPYY